MPITPLPPAPTRDDPTNFSSRGDALMTALPAFVTEANALADQVSSDAAAAIAASTSFIATVNVAKWVSGTTYVEGEVVWSPANYLTYRRKIAGAGTTDPSADATNWALMVGTGDVTLVGVQTLTNKRITLRVSSSATIASPLAWSSNNFDQYASTAQTAALVINADSGTPTDGQKMIFRFKDNGTPRALTWTTGSTKAFRPVGVTLPTTTVTSKVLYVGCIYNSTESRWDVIAVAQEA